MAMKVLGIQRSFKNGKSATTLHTESEFAEWLKDEAAGRSAIGKQVETIYVGDYDCSSLKVGDSVEIYFSQAFKNGATGAVYQQVKLIQVVNK